jgi:hypothetical protein
MLQLVPYLDTCLVAVVVVEVVDFSAAVVAVSVVVPAAALAASEVAALAVVEPAEAGKNGK